MLETIKRQWPADKIKLRAVESLKPYENNPRLHSPDQIARIARSIGEFGFTMPVLVDDVGNIIAGHGRVAAAKLMGLAEVPCVMAAGWSEAQRRAYMIADNQRPIRTRRRKPHKRRSASLAIAGYWAVIGWFAATAPRLRRFPPPWAG